MEIPAPWPAAWKGKSKGDQVFVHREGSQALPVSNSPPTCRERIRKAFFSKCTGGECARNIDAITPDDVECKAIDRNVRIGYTKEP